MWLAEALGMTLSQKMFNQFLKEKNINSDLVIQDYLLVYCDDLGIFTKSEEEHFLVIKFVFWALKKSGLRVQQNKMVIMAEKFKILGITYTQIPGQKSKYLYSMKEDRVGELQELPFPTSPRALGSRLSIFSYYNNVLLYLSWLPHPYTCF